MGKLLACFLIFQFVFISGNAQTQYCGAPGGRYLVSQSGNWPDPNPVHTRKLYKLTQKYDGSSTFLFIDVYEPQGLDPSEKRPTIVFIPDGDLFATESVDVSFLKLAAQQFATLGYTTAVPEYRSGYYGAQTDIDSLCQINYYEFEKASYRGLVDMHSAINYLVDPVNDFAVDNKAIITAGYAAGGIMAQQLTFLQQNEIDTIISNSIGLLDGLNATIIGAVMMSGTFLNNGTIRNEQTPVLWLHGTCNPLITYGVDPLAECSAFSAKPLYGPLHMEPILKNANIQYHIRTNVINDASILTELADTALQFMYRNVLCSESIQVNSQYQYATDPCNYNYFCGFSNSQQINRENEFRVVPNLFDQVLNIESEKLVRVEIRDIHGALILNKKLMGKHEFPAASWADGIYFVVVFGDNGMDQVIRIVKQQ